MGNFGVLPLILSRFCVWYCTLKAFTPLKIVTLCICDGLFGQRCQSQLAGNVKNETKSTVEYACIYM